MSIHLFVLLFNLLDYFKFKFSTLRSTFSPNVLEEILLDRLSTKLAKKLLTTHSICDLISFKHFPQQSTVDSFDCISSWVAVSELNEGLQNCCPISAVRCLYNCHSVHTDWNFSWAVSIWLQGRSV